MFVRSLNEENTKTHYQMILMEETINPNLNVNLFLGTNDK